MENQESNTGGVIFPVIHEGKIGADTVQTVNARDLHRALGVGKDFSNWIKDRVSAYEFSQNSDFVVYAETGENPSGGRPAKEYAITLDMAKELAMVERNDAGKRVRQYFIACEKAVKAAHATLDRMGPEFKAALGGIVKSIIHKEVGAIVDARVEAAIAADPRRAVLNYVSVRQILDDAKALPKGRNSINRKIGRDLKIAALIGHEQVLKCPHSSVWLYPRAFADKYMVDRGAAMVSEHNDRVLGQGVIRFPDRRQRKSYDNAHPA